jgi:hypothetical protein
LGRRERTEAGDVAGRPVVADEELPVASNAKRIWESNKEIERRIRKKKEKKRVHSILLISHRYLAHPTLDV